MADFAGAAGAAAARGLGTSVGSAITDAARERFAASFAGHYSEAQVKGWVLSTLQKIKSDVRTLLESNLDTAQQTMTSWCNSSAPLRGELRMEWLRSTRANASLAFNTAQTTTDKIKAVSLIILSEYHIAALESEDFDWSSGKTTAQESLLQYHDEMKTQLTTAAEQELGFTKVLPKLKKERRAILIDFINLSSVVLHLAPHSQNDAHPRFDLLEKAALHAYDNSRSNMMLEAKISPFISETRFRWKLIAQSSPMVTCCSVLENGTRAVSGSHMNTLEVWDLAAGEAIKTLEGHTGGVNCCALSVDGTQVVSGSEDKTLKVWDLAQEYAVKTLKGHTSGVLCCAVFANGTRAISGSKDKTLKVWNLTTGEAIHALEGHESRVTRCTVFKDGARAVSVSSDNTLKVWDLNTGGVIKTREGLTSRILCCAVFENCARAVSVTGDNDQSLEVWDLVSGEEICRLEGHTGPIKCCAVYANGTRAISGSENGTSVKVWDLETGEKIHELSGNSVTVKCCAGFAQGTKVITGGGDSLMVWDLPSAVRPGPQRLRYTT